MLLKESCFFVLSVQHPFFSKIQIMFLKESCISRCPCSYRWPRGVRLSEDVKCIIASLLRRQPGERPTAEQLLTHPWVTGQLFASTPNDSSPDHAPTEASATDALSTEGSGAVEPRRQTSVVAMGDSPLPRRLLADARGGSAMELAAHGCSGKHVCDSLRSTFLDILCT